MTLLTRYMLVMNKILCWLLGHNYFVNQTFGSCSRRVCCDRCGGDWAMHDPSMSFVEWDVEFEDMYRVLGHTIYPRRRK